MANDDLTQWLRQRLSQERELLEKRHNALLDEFQEHLNQETQCCTLLSPDMIAVQMEVEEMVTSPVNDPGTGEDQLANEAEVQGRVDQVVDAKKNSPGKKLQAALSFISAQRPRSIPDTFMARLVTSRGFEFFFAAMIFLNMVEMALEMQYEGFSSGFELGYPGYPKPKEDTWPGMTSGFRIASWVFGIAYTIEVICKLLGLRSSFFFDMVNLFDALVVILFYVEKGFASLSFPMDTMVLRLFRLCKVLRVLELVHEVAGLGKLLLMITALKRSLQMLTWAAMLLLGLQTLFAFFLHELLLEIVIENDNYSANVRVQCFKYFGTFSRAIFSMFELTLANWIPISRFLIDDVSEFFVIFTIGYKLTLGFAVVGVVNACFIKETFKIVASDRVMMVIEKTHEKASFVKEMTRFMASADKASDHDGTLTLEEFERVCHDEGVKNWLAAQGLEASDARKLFELMDDGSGSLETSELVKGVAKLKGPAKSLDMAVMSSDGQQMLRRMAEVERKLQRIEAERHVTVPDAAQERANMLELSATLASVNEKLAKQDRELSCRKLNL